MRFIHTADWQVGMKADHVGQAAEQVRQVRLQSAERVVKAASEHNAEFILVAGDTFEDNGVDRVLVQRATDILAAFSRPVYIISGNHDPLVPGSVWDHPAWQSHKNLYVLDREQPTPIPGGVLYPCIAREKRSTRNPLDWVDAGDSKDIAIAAAHGTVEGIHQGEPDYPIRRDAPSSTGLDYVALGHWHSTTTYNDSSGAVRMAYSGTHEPTRFGERDSGNILKVEISGRGQPPSVEAIRIGTLSWQVLETDVRQPGDVGRILKEIEGVRDPASTLLRVQIRGALAAEEFSEIGRIRELAEARFLFSSVDDSGLLPAPKDQSWVAGLPAGPLRTAAERLAALVDPTFAGQRPEAATPEVAARALLELFALVHEGAR